MVIAVDFDGTIVEHKYPCIGKEIPFAISTLKRLLEEGHRIILYGRYVREIYCGRLSIFAGNGDWNFMPSMPISLTNIRMNRDIAGKLKPTFLLMTGIWVVCRIGESFMTW